MTSPSTSAFDPELPASPYPGLRPYQRQEWPVFFGREIMADDVVGRLLDQQFVLIHGSSGCGKSSLVQAGILPRLGQARVAGGPEWRDADMRPGDGPLRALAEAVADLCGWTDTERVVDLRRALNRGRDAASQLADHIRAATPAHVCLLIDQFEELFRFAREVSRDEVGLFMEVLLGFIENPPDGMFLIATMRSDFLGECARFEGLAEAFNRTQYLLPRMSRPNLLRAIREPAALVGGDVAEDLAERLVAEAGSSEDELPLVQHGLRQLWLEAVQGGADAPRLTLRQYRASAIARRPPVGPCRSGLALGRARAWRRAGARGNLPRSDRRHGGRRSGPPPASVQGARRGERQFAGDGEGHSRRVS